MKKITAATVILLFALSSCTTTKLYSWSNYDSTSYNYLKNRDDKSVEELIKTYERIIAGQKGTRKVVPPGIYADYGFILVQSGKIEEGIKMMKMEVSLYPESAQFVSNIIKIYEK